MPEKAYESVHSNELVAELLRQAKADFENDRRAEQRFPFFHPISIQVDDRSFSAFTREIGASGIGLLQNMELPLQDVMVTIPGRGPNVPLRIEWCAPIGEGWYISGGSFACDKLNSL
jgi:hypothetical protein